MQVTDFYTKHHPSKIAELPKILFRYKGREAQLLAALDTKYALDIDLSPARLQVVIQKLQKAKHTAVQTEDYDLAKQMKLKLEQLLLKYPGSGGATSAHPAAPSSTSSTSTSSSLSPTSEDWSAISAELSSPDGLEVALSAFYARYEPAKLTKLPSILFRYKGREAQLLGDLKHKYEQQQQQQHDDEDGPAGHASAPAAVHDDGGQQDDGGTSPPAATKASAAAGGELEAMDEPALLKVSQSGPSLHPAPCTALGTAWAPPPTCMNA
jgi:hypothetical protein